jgi:hypothetical protein
VITALSATVLPNQMVTLTGTVTNDQPASVVLNFTGAVADTASADAAGHFRLTSQGNYLGAVSAVATDGQNLTSDTVTAQVSTPAPYISYRVTPGTGRSVTLSGTVTSVDKGSLTITFNGVVTGSVATNADGTFSYTATATGQGNVYATAVDLWGQSSNTATVTVTADPPLITELDCSHGPDGWTFYGHVSDAYSPGVTITFGGLSGLANQTVTVQANGTFSLTVQLANGDYGTATAVATSVWGLQSDASSTDVPAG